jgi:hypothetical protein
VGIGVDVGSGVAVGGGVAVAVDGGVGGGAFTTGTAQAFAAATDNIAAAASIA